MRFFILLFRIDNAFLVAAAVLVVGTFLFFFFFLIRQNDESLGFQISRRIQFVRNFNTYCVRRVQLHGSDTLVQNYE